MGRRCEEMGDEGGKKVRLMREREQWREVGRTDEGINRGKEKDDECE